MSESYPHPTDPLVWSLGACVPLWTVALILGPTVPAVLSGAASAGLNILLGLVRGRANRLGWALGAAAVAIAVAACVAAHGSGGAR